VTSLLAWMLCHPVILAVFDFILMRPSELGQNVQSTMYVRDTDKVSVNRTFVRLCLRCLSDEILTHIGFLSEVTIVHGERVPSTRHRFVNDLVRKYLDKILTFLQRGIYPDDLFTVKDSFDLGQEGSAFIVYGMPFPVAYFSRRPFILSV